MKNMIRPAVILVRDTGIETVMPGSPGKRLTSTNSGLNCGYPTTTPESRGT
jgi:hypothetical protein